MAVEWIRYELLDLSGRSLGWLGSPERPQVVTNCTVEWTQYGQIHASGSLTLDGSLDWQQLCVAPTRYVRGTTTVAHRRGVYLMAGGRRTVNREWIEADGDMRLVVDETTDVTLYGQEYRLARQPITDPLDWPAGTRYTDAMVETLDMVGITDVAVTHSPLTMPAPWHVDPGTDSDDAPRNLLTAHNKLAEAINYWSLRFSPEGRAVVAPYVPAAQRPREYRFAPEPDADWYRGEVGEESDGWDIPNVLVGVARQEDEAPPLVYTARNHDRGPYSFAARGYWVGPQGGPEHVDAPDLTTLEAVMERKLAVASTAARTWEVDALWQPWAGSEVGTLTHGDIDALTSLTKWSEHVHDVAAPMRLTLEEVL